MLSFHKKNKNSRAIASTTNKGKKKIIYYNQEPECDSDEEDICEVFDKLFTSGMEHIKLKKEKLQILPSLDRRDIIYISGPSGVGKSTVTSNFAKSYNKLFPDNEVFLFSRKDEDPAFDKLKFLTRIDFDETFIENPLHPKDVQDSLCIFDDAHNYRGKLGKEIMNTQVELMDLGRSYNVSVIITSHLIANFKQSRAILNELHGLVIYPAAGSYHQIRYALKTYMGVSNEFINKIMKLKTRWCYINKFPKYVVYEKGAFIFS